VDQTTSHDDFYRLHRGRVRCRIQICNKNASSQRRAGAIVESRYAFTKVRAEFAVLQNYAIANLTVPIVLNVPVLAVSQN
jgi:hypothetical protein